MGAWSELQTKTEPGSLAIYRKSPLVPSIEEVAFLD